MHTPQRRKDGWRADGRKELREEGGCRGEWRVERRERHPPPSKFRAGHCSQKGSHCARHLPLLGLGRGDQGRGTQYGALGSILAKGTGRRQVCVGPMWELVCQNEPCAFHCRIWTMARKGILMAAQGGPWRPKARGGIRTFATNSGGIGPSHFAFTDTTSTTRRSELKVNHHARTCETQF